MKILLKSFICLSLVLSFFSITIYAESDKEENIDLSRYNTYERPMPNTNDEKELDDWVSETSEYLEKFYNQKIIRIDYDVEKISFIFDTVPLCVNEQVESIEYYKQSNTKATTGDYKLTTYSSWSNGASPVTVQTKTASNISTAASITLNLIPSYTYAK